MAISGLNTVTLLLIVLILLICISNNGVYAFGAGNIPSFAYMEGKAFRHGDIEDVLAELVKSGVGTGGLTALLHRGHKFNGLDVKRVYFGNWLRDYSQAVDIAGLKKLSVQQIVNLCMALGFLAHGYATGEFEVTEERLGVYLPTEHIDNPKGYGEGEDPRKYHPKLRPPIDPTELEIDPRTGMKNYIANENGNWDTSKGLVRRTLERCIAMGRQFKQSGNKADIYEAYRLLGQSLHTLEDFPAHSTFTELALVSMGHTQVFCHVGDQVRVQAKNGKMVAPLVTGTFGGNDFMHSLLGEATDHISQASVTDLNKAISDAKSKSGGNSRGFGGGGNGMMDSVMGLMNSVPGGSEVASRDLNSIEQVRAASQPGGGGKRPEDMSPQELHAVLWQVLSARDSIMKKISIVIEKIPGLGPLLDKISDSISVFVFTTLEPFLKPIMKTATTGLSSASAEVVNSIDQYEVFNDPRASDPTHSFLSKDHFNLILNEPAGNLAKVIVKYTVPEIVKAWDDAHANPQQVIEPILDCLFHPDFYNPNSAIQSQMMNYMQQWVQSLGHRQHDIINRLSKQNVRDHKNIRMQGEGGVGQQEQSWAASQGHALQHEVFGYANQIPGVQQAQNIYGRVSNPFGGQRRDMPSGPEGGPSPPPNFPSPPPGSQNSFAPPSGPPPGQYGGGGPSFPEPPHQQNSYGPPSGPPPGQYGGQSQGYYNQGGPPQQQQWGQQQQQYPPPQGQYYPPPGQGGGYQPNYGGGGGGY